MLGRTSHFLFLGGTSSILRTLNAEPVKNTLQLTKQIPPLAHEVVYDWVDRTVALENGKLRIGKDVFLFLKKLYNLIMGASDSFCKLL